VQEGGIQIPGTLEPVLGELGPVQIGRSARGQDWNQCPRGSVCSCCWGEFKLMWQADGNQCRKSVGTETKGSKGECIKLDQTDDLRKQGIEQGKSRLNCIYFNARGLTGKADELRTWVDTWDWDITTTTETWLREGQDRQLNVPGYRCYRKDRTGGKRGGGVAF